MRICITVMRILSGSGVSTDADPDPNFLLNADSGLLIEVLRVRDHCTTDPICLHFEPPRLHF
jgi:hypothetical protein